MNCDLRLASLSIGVGPVQSPRPGPYTGGLATESPPARAPLGRVGDLRAGSLLVYGPGHRRKNDFAYVLSIRAIRLSNRNRQPLILQVPAPILLALDRLEKCLEVAFAKALAAFALDNLDKKRRSILHGLAEDL